MKMTGAQIEDVLERQWLGQPVDGIKMMQISGITYSWSASAPVGDRVAPGDIYIGGTMLDPTVTYTVTANSFLADGGDNFTTFRNATDKVVGGIDLDALIEYVVQLPQPFDVMIEGRAQLLP
jgi:5'-nucleotidase